jgi:hypothetical protein
MKTRLIQLIAGFTMSVLCISACTSTANATVMWEDDFSDPNLPGWTLYGYTDYINATDWVKTEGNFSNTDGTLKVLDDEVNIARHNSDVTVGTWSFDMYIPNDDLASFYVDVMSNGTYGWFGARNTSLYSVGYWNNKFIVWEWVYEHIEVFANIVVDPLEGWHHFDIIRESGGHFEVYHNGTLRANFTNNDVTSSTYLQVYCENCSGAAIDNLVVSDDITDGGIVIDGPFLIGVVVAGVVIIVAVVFFRRR